MHANMQLKSEQWVWPNSITSQRLVDVLHPVQPKKYLTSDVSILWSQVVNVCGHRMHLCPNSRPNPCRLGGQTWPNRLHVQRNCLQKDRKEHDMRIERWMRYERMNTREWEWERERGAQSNLYNLPLNEWQILTDIMFKLQIGQKRMDVSELC